MSNVRALPGNYDAERRIHLERYLQSWLTGHALKLSDLARADVRDRLLKTLSADFGSILGRSAEIIAGQIGLGVMKAATGAIQKGAARLLGLGGESR